MKLIDFPHLHMFVFYDAMQKKFDKKCLRILPAGIYRVQVLFLYKRPSTVGTTREWDLFMGGPYMMKYGMYFEALFCHSLTNISLYVLLNG